MNISLTPQLSKMVNDKVASGLYNNASEVIRESLRLMQMKEFILASKLQVLRQEIQIGVDAADRGEVYELDEAFKMIEKKSRIKRKKKK